MAKTKIEDLKERAELEYRRGAGLMSAGRFHAAEACFAAADDFANRVSVATGDKWTVAGWR